MELSINMMDLYKREVVQNVKNRLDCRKFHLNTPITSNAIGHFWVIFGSIIPENYIFANVFIIKGGEPLV